MASGNGLFTPIRSAITLVLLLLLASCATPTPESEVDAPATVEQIDQAEQESTVETTPEQPVEGLTAELLYDILVASVASQRRQPEVALGALSRAVYLSRNQRLTANAIQLALHVKDFQKAIELSRLLLTQDPDNFRIHLALASAQIQSDKLDAAADTLKQLANAQEQGDEPVLQEIATMVARQEKNQSLSLTRLISAEAEQTPQLIFIRAIIASRLSRKQDFRRLINQSLEMQPRWETAAILKLTDLAETDKPEMRQWAEQYLNTNPGLEHFRTQFARLLIKEKEYQRALKELDTVLAKNPTAQDALFAAAVISLDLEDDAAAEQHFANYIEVSEYPDQARLYLAQLYVEQERFAEASTLLRAVQSNQYYLDAQITLSGVIAKQSNVDAGLSYLRNIDVRGEEDTVRLILEQDSLLQDFELLERSLELLSTALKERPEQPDLLYSRGLLAAQMNRLELIEKDMRKLIELQPENAHAYNALGYTLADQTDRYDEAEALLGKALEYLPDDAFILDSMGWLQFRIGNLDKALEYLERAMSIRQDAEIAAHLGEVLWANGNRKRAEQIWKQGLELGPDNPILIKTIDRLKSNKTADEDQHAHFIYAPLIVALHLRPDHLVFPFNDL